ncbi:RNA 3'-terminal phosphate cyclase [Methylocucumis oryzae]|uniref:RNA 3'-terminal phosphate cyclase n=1 Tax=Methylocucumis oryzae TaxID=1632867 RepID=A0A0F3IF93_9GAMM|nr:RNA 3'-terminal phosphate cyclase [Methylocucumis oryzae]KJV05357.1 RNA 3'-terminal-phosphate cyclase [Methylocucumis oryzae]
MIELDGSQGEGGGQILRTALSLAMCTGQAVHLKHIRAKRDKPGLMRQHLTAVQAAQAICRAQVQGAEIGSSELVFTPNTVQGGTYKFSIGTAGSCTLVLQTLLPALLFTNTASCIELSGGTHNPMSPPFHFLSRAFVPLLRRMGADIELELLRYGFYPAGGGQLICHIQPCTQLTPLTLCERGPLIEAYAEAVFSAIPFHIAERELAVIKQNLNWSDTQLLPLEIARQQGPGNALMVTLVHEHCTEVLVGFGEKGVSAEKVAKRVVSSVRHYQTSKAAVAGFLADQLLLPLALAGGGQFTTTEWSQHAATNAEVISQFLPVHIGSDRVDKDAFQVVVAPVR